ncbi:MAG: PAS domain S-box protein [Rhodospirillum sp.]|nr:PAS domain S-box protein [Rhodospirillum sp.]MCF8489373.1 PAS domain S-box protein [Rhodospirillum sp.]MCF8501727.1 PAS domain S-box protein [Rhodospirillum sp.]
MTDTDAWNLIFENAAMAMALFDARGDTLAANESLARLTGLPVEEIVGASRQLLTVLDDRGQIHDFGRYLRAQAPCSGIATLRRADGGTLDVVFTAGRNATTDPREETFLVTLADIEDERCLSCRIRDSRDRFREAMDEQPEMLCRCLPDTTITFVNESFATLFGRTPREMLGQRIRDLTPPEGRSELDRHLASFSPRLPVRDLHGALRHPQGDRIYLWWRRRALFNGDGTIAAFSATARDITPQVEAERRADLGEERFRQIFDQSPTGMALVDYKGRFVQINQALSRLMEREAMDLLGGLVLDHMPADNREDDLAWLRGLLDGGGSGQATERRLTLGSGRPVWVEISGSPLPGDGIAPSLCILTIQDIEDRRSKEENLRRARDQAEAASEAKSYFLHNMSHELRTPLNAIIGFGEVIGQGLPNLPLDARYRDYAQDIVQSGRHLLDIINDILDIARVETGAFTLDVETLDLPTLVEESLILIRDRAKTKGLTLEVPPPFLGPSRVHGDRRAIKQILINLLTNAVKFTDTGGLITVSMDSGPDGLSLHVIDTGFGIAPMDLERVFEPFVQAERRESLNLEGTGLGLPLCRRLAEMHGGTLRLESVLNRGSRFTLFLPWRT